MPLIVEAAGSRSTLRLRVRRRGVLVALSAVVITAAWLLAGLRPAEPPASALERDAGVIETVVNNLGYHPNLLEWIAQPGRVWNDPVTVSDQTINLDEFAREANKKGPDAAMADLTSQTREFTPALAAEFRRRNLRSSSLAGLPFRRRVEVLSQAQIDARHWALPGAAVVQLPRPTVVRFSRPAYSPDGHAAIVYWEPGDRGGLLFLTWSAGGWKIVGGKLFWIA